MEFLKKNIGLKTVVFTIAAILFLFFISQIKDIAILFFASFVISCSLNPLVDKLSKKMSRGIASSIVLFGSILFIMLFFVPILIMGGEQIRSFINVLPEHLTHAKNFLMTLPFVNKAEISDIDLGAVFSSASGITTNIISNLTSLSKDLATGLIYILAACIIIFYFLSDKDQVREAYIKLFPHNMKEKAENIIESISEKIGGYVIAQIVTMTSVGAIVLVGLMVLRVDYALLLGLITALFDIVPIVGPALAFVVIMLVVFKMGPVTIGLVIALFAFAQWAENNLVRPYIFSKFLDLHPLIIYFFLFVTAKYLGIVGVVFAPAIAATVCVLFEELYIKNINQ